MVAGLAVGLAAFVAGSMMVVVSTNSMRKVAQTDRCCKIVTVKVVPALIDKRKNQATSARRSPSV